MKCLGAGQTLSSGGLRRARGFTLIELAAVVTIILVLVSLLTAALNHTKAKALRVSCINNLKQLQGAWILYAQDNESFFPLNQTAPAPVEHHRIPISLKTAEGSWVTGSPLLDTTTENIKKGTLFEYVGSPDIYRCPMDDSTVYRHPDVLRTRSYAMSAYLGGDPADPRVKFKESELINPRPENTFVFIEEHPSSIWAANFMVVPRNQLSISSALSWVSTPGDRHYQGCNLSFADGHVEYWRWYAAKGSGGDLKLASAGREIRDIRRLQACVPHEH